jgi:formate hydrogenlyase subunit 3/multisubunit Na+/H+ antiporter MnhD subunit
MGIAIADVIDPAPLSRPNISLSFLSLSLSQQHFDSRIIWLLLLLLFFGFILSFSLTNVCRRLAKELRAFKLLRSTHELLAAGAFNSRKFPSRSSFEKN